MAMFLFLVNDAKDDWSEAKGCIGILRLRALVVAVLAVENMVQWIFYTRGLIHQLMEYAC